jgi:hypothetical protein
MRASSSEAPDAVEAERHEVELRPGEEHVLVLPGKGPVGLAWMTDVQGDPDVVEVVHEAAEEPGTGPGMRPPGEGVPQRFRLRAGRPGVAVVALELRSPPTPDEPPYRRVEVNLRVRD